jgi:hypothetical protein
MSRRREDGNLVREVMDGKAITVCMSRPGVSRRLQWRSKPVDFPRLHL